MCMVLKLGTIQKIDQKYLEIFKTFISVINQLDAQNFCFTISLFRASTCFEHMCSSSGGQKASGIITPIGGRLVRK